MDQLATIFLLFIITIAIVMFPFVTIEKISKVKAKKSPPNIQPVLPPCTCHVGPQQPNKYYHAYTCRYRQQLELKS